MHDQHVVDVDRAHDRREVLQRVVRHLRIDADVDRERGDVAEQQRVAVGRRLRDELGADHAARAGLVLDDDRAGRAPPTAAAARRARRSRRRRPAGTARPAGSAWSDTPARTPAPRRPAPARDRRPCDVSGASSSSSSLSASLDYTNSAHEHVHGPRASKSVECWVLRAPIAEPVANAFGAMTNRPARVPAHHGERRRVGLGRGVLQFSAGRRRASRAPRRQHLRAAARRRRRRRPGARCARCSSSARGGWRSSAASPDRSRRSPAPSTRRCGTSRRGAPACRCGSTWAAATACASTRAASAPTRVGDGRARQARRRLPRVQAEGGLRRRARRREPRRDARGARRRRDDHVRREPGVVAGRGARAHRRARAVPPALDRGADRRGRAARRVAARSRERAPSRSPPARTCAGARRSTTRSTPATSRFVQPDVGKWGGISGGLDVARHAAARGVAYCPHWLAGGVGPRGVDARAGRARQRGKATPRSTRIRTRCARRCSRSRSIDGWVTLSGRAGAGRRARPRAARALRGRVEL